MLERDYFATPGGPRQPTPEALQRYQLHPYQASMVKSTVNRRQRDQEFQASGDALTVLMISGPDILGVSIGAKDNPFIPVREGMLLRRPFDSFRVRLLTGRNDILPTTPETIALFGTSYGQLLEHPGYKRRLFEPGAFTVTSDVGAAGVDLLSISNIQTRWALSTPVPSFLRWGGTLRVHNRDAATPVFLYFGRPGVADPLPIEPAPSAIDQVAWQLDPGQKEEFVFESGLLWNRKTGPEINDQAFNLSLFAQTTGPTVRVATLFSTAVRDLTDADCIPASDRLEALGGTT